MTGQRPSLWAEALAPASDLATPERTDVLVVGAGLAGLLTAVLLQQAGHDVLVVDRHRVGGQATRNTTAKVTALQGTVLSSIVEARGEDAAADYAAANQRAVGAIRSLVRELGIDCDLTDAPAFTHATEPSGLEAAEAELAAATAAGLPVTWTTETDLPHPVLGAVRLDDQAHLHPVRLCQGLARHLGPTTVVEGVSVLDVEEHRDRCEVHLDGGRLVTAEHVVLATQAPILDPAALANRCHPEQSYVVSLRVQGPLPQGMYLSSDSSTRSIRPAATPGGPVLLVGGAGHPVGEPEAAPERFDELVTWAEQHWGPAEVTHRWGTHDLTPTDHVPFIGRLAPTLHRRWVATGFQKWGMTNSYVAAHLITEQISGRDVDWQETFDSTRLQASLTGELVSAGARAARHMVGDRVQARLDDTDPEALAMGAGIVTSVRGTPVAVHRAEDGVHAVSARCTHQGCLVAFDGATRTFACPCHGSRYDLDGRVLQGPAIEGLGPVEL